MNPLVSASWLKARLDDPNTVIVDATLPPVGVTPPVDVHSRYLAQHLPGAVFFDIEALSDHATTLPHMLQTPEAFAQDMSALGIGSPMTIVVYEQEGVFSAPRAWWMLRTFGAQQVYLLDGGLRAWIEAGFATGDGPVQRVPAIFEADVRHGAVRDLAQVQQTIAAAGQVLDARSAVRFDASSPEPRPGLRSGHMPGARNLPFTDMLADGRFKPVEQLMELFAARQVDLQQPITSTCGSGVTAAVIALALEMCGASEVGLYDGSWAEYASHPEAVIQTGP